MSDGCNYDLPEDLAKYEMPCGPEMPQRITSIRMDNLGNVYDQNGIFIGHGIMDSKNRVTVYPNMPEIKAAIK